MAQSPQPPSSSPARPSPAALPRWAMIVLPVAVGGAALTGLLLVPGRWSALLLLAVLVVLGWLTSRSWPLLDRTGRLIRMVVLGALTAAVVLRLAG